MAHKTLIGGTAYEISGGKTLVNGTAYKIKNGKTLVGGTAYEVGFTCTVTITSKTHERYDSYHASVTIDGQTYNGYPEIELVVPSGTIATCYAHTADTGTAVLKYPAYIQVNGVDVTSGYGGISYPYKITKDVTIDVGYDKVGGTMGTSQKDRGSIIITEH